MPFQCQAWPGLQRAAVVQQPVVLRFDQQRHALADFKSRDVGPTGRWLVRHVDQPWRADRPVFKRVSQFLTGVIVNRNEFLFRRFYRMAIFFA